LHAHKKMVTNPDDPLQHSDNEGITAESLKRLSLAHEIDNDARNKTGQTIFDSAFTRNSGGGGGGASSSSSSSSSSAATSSSLPPRAMSNNSYGSMNKSGSAAEKDKLVGNAAHHDEFDAELGGVPVGAVQPADPGSRKVGMAIYLGLLIDSVPESFIIGVMVKDNELTAAFMLGVFLSNLPEALSSADIMKLEGHDKRTILSLWIGLVVVTALGAGFGAIIISKDAHLEQRALEGLGGGAMLAVICGTMIPEAFSHGGNRTAISTVAGFLTAVTVSIMFD